MTAKPPSPYHGLTLKHLRSLPTLCEGQADDLKIDSPTWQVWLSRCTVADGEPFDNKVTIMRRDGERWIEHDIYPAVK